MKVLNLYSGVGGNRLLWNNVEVTAIEKDAKIATVYKELHPLDNVLIEDAHQYLLEHFQEFGFIWSSPPCQGNTKMIRSGRNRKSRYPDLRMYEEIIFLQNNFKGFWVVENVVPYYTPLIAPTKKIGRHLFWSNFNLPDVHEPKFEGFINRQNMEAKKQLHEWLGLYYEGNIYYEKNHCVTQVLRNCVHPKIGKAILNAALWDEL